MNLHHYISHININGSQDMLSCHLNTNLMGVETSTKTLMYNINSYSEPICWEYLTAKDIPLLHIYFDNRQYILSLHCYIFYSYIIDHTMEYLSIIFDEYKNI